MIVDLLEKSLHQVIEAKKESILAIGNDIIYLPNFEKSLTPEFVNKVYAPEELTYILAFSDPVLRYASTFAAKEAVYKCLKQIHPHQTIVWKEIKILRKKPAGQPEVFIEPLAAASHHKISITITHDNDYVWAIALMMQ
jgi:holo-[acyl-carrier protein] synthase